MGRGFPEMCLHLSEFQLAGTAKGQLGSEWENRIPGQAAPLYPSGCAPRSGCASLPGARVGDKLIRSIPQAAPAVLELLQGLVNSRNIKGWERAAGVWEFGELDDYLALINP